VEERAEPVGTDKNVLLIGEVRRYRGTRLKFVVFSTLPSFCAAPTPTTSRFAQKAGLGLKASDEFTVPPMACTPGASPFGNEAAWWRRADIHPLKLARSCWKTTKPTRRRRTAADPSEGPREPDSMTASLASLGNPIRSQPGRMQYSRLLDAYGASERKHLQITSQFQPRSLP
jgi:hypothetical protein